MEIFQGNRQISFYSEKLWKIENHIPALHFFYFYKMIHVYPTNIGP